MAEESSSPVLSAPAVKCSYCGTVYQDEDKSDMGFETGDWAVCSKCFRKACDKVLGGKL